MLENKPNAPEIKKELARLREFIDKEPSWSLAARVAYEVECAIRWITEDTVGWQKPLESAKETARLICKENNL